LSSSSQTSTAVTPCLEAALAIPPTPSPLPLTSADTRSVRAELLCDRHGPALYLLALTVTGCPGEAQRAVAAVIADACRPPDRLGPVGDHGARRELARRVYAECTSREERAEFDTGVRPLVFEDFMPWLGALSRYQRAAIALCLYGEHRAWQAANVLEVSTATVHELLFWGLQDLTQWTRSPAAKPVSAPPGRQRAGD
jgi:hypothetical protein